MSKHVYVADKSSGFKFTVVMDDEKDREVRIPIVFEQGQFKTDDDKLAAEIDKLIATNLPIRQRIRKTDKTAAEALAKQHMAMRQKTGAVKGGVTSIAMQQAMNSHLQQRDAELMKEAVDRAEFADQDLVLTEQTHVEMQPVAQPSTDGGDPDKSVEAAAKPKINLGK